MYFFTRSVPHLPHEPSGLGDSTAGWPINTHPGGNSQDYHGTANPSFSQGGIIASGRGDRVVYGAALEICQQLSQTVILRPN